MMLDGDPGWALLTMLVVLAFALSTAWFVQRSAGTQGRDHASEILDERRARGDMTEEAYLAARTTLARSRRVGRRRAPAGLFPTAALVVAAAAMVLAASAATGGSRWPKWVQSMHDGLWGDDDEADHAPPAVEGAREIRVVAAEFLFEPTAIRVDAGETVNIVLENRGAVFHDLHVAGLDWELEADADGADTGAFTAPVAAGFYPVECDVPGHATAGMRATLIVEP